ncbi:transposase [Paramecium bursaria Chlorella virus NE-JV-4]|uniref:Transposase n=1 Tax=Paramecium bursaria Chlorella virus IL3A TaxID=46019 RepID=M1HV30_PBCVI|nr:transposase [Paramecium bursaria Chlorella virus IL3A]AGE57465.1 transposase [Paramecium bursaria Chlorella virus NE-JV-4]
MLSALIHIKTKEKNSTENAVIPVIHKTVKPKSTPNKEPKQKKDRSPKAKGPKAKEPKAKGPKAKGDKKLTNTKVKSFEDGIDYASFTPLEDKHENAPEPWNDDGDLEGGTVKFDNDIKYEDENEKYLRQDTEWKDVMKRQKKNFDDNSDSDDDSDEDTSSEIKTPSIASQEYNDEHTDDTYSEIGDLADLDDFDIACDETDSCDDVFYPKTVIKEQKEKPKRVFIGADITFDDEFIP